MGGCGAPRFSDPFVGLNSISVNYLLAAQVMIEGLGHTILEI